MRKREIAEPYAAALVELVKSTNTSEIVTEDFHKVVEIYQENYELREFLINPLYSKALKKDLIEKIFKPLNINDNIKKFLNILIDRSRIELLNIIAEKYAKMIYVSEKSEIAFVSSVIPFTEKQENFIIQQLQSKLNLSTILVYSALDSTLLAGLKIHIGSNIIDLSLKGQLLSMGENLELGSRFQIFRTEFDTSFTKEIKRLAESMNYEKTKKI
jgi:F-type H+-transporting ATPase subunit delta